MSTQLNSLYNDLGSRLRFLIEASYKGQREFARETDTNISLLNRYVMNQSKPGSDFLVKIGKLGFNLNWLLLGNGEIFHGQLGKELKFEFLLKLIIYKTYQALNNSKVKITKRVFKVNANFLAFLLTDDVDILYKINDFFNEFNIKEISKSKIKKYIITQPIDVNLLFSLVGHSFSMALPFLHISLSNLNDRLESIIDIDLIINTFAWEYNNSDRCHNSFRIINRTFKEIELVYPDFYIVRSNKFSYPYPKGKFLVKDEDDNMEESFFLYYAELLIPMLDKMNQETMELVKIHGNNIQNDDTEIINSNLENIIDKTVAKTIEHLIEKGFLKSNL